MPQKPNRYREKKYVTPDKATWRALERLVRAGLFRFPSRAMDEAVADLVRKYERLGKLPPDPPDLGDEAE